MHVNMHIFRCPIPPFISKGKLRMLKRFALFSVFSRLPIYMASTCMLKSPISVDRHLQATIINANAKDAIRC